MEGLRAELAALNERTAAAEEELSGLVVTPTPLAHVFAERDAHKPEFEQRSGDTARLTTASSSSWTTTWPRQGARMTVPRLAPSRPHVFDDLRWHDALLLSPSGLPGLQERRQRRLTRPALQTGQVQIRVVPCGVHQGVADGGRGLDRPPDDVRAEYASGLGDRLGAAERLRNGCSRIPGKDAAR
ncbi:hypothetical protein [Streptomyces wuyuanensis]|uniref:hypothetical protein n=1 Tax=Streptomyces wuyuanensis TaxID=1196353 RepID=UPI003D716154